MRILTVVRNFGLRGTQRVAQNYSVAYRRAGHDVAVLAWETDGPRRRFYETEGVDILEPDTGGPALELARGFAPDLLHIHRAGPPDAEEERVLRALRGSSGCVLETNVFGRFDPRADQLIDLHGQLTRAGLYRWQRLANGRSRGVPFYLPNAVDFDSFRVPNPEDVEQLRGELRVPAGDVVVGAMGKMAPSLSRTVVQLLKSRRDLWFATVTSPDALSVLAGIPGSLRRRCLQLEPSADDARLATYYGLFDLLLHHSANGESFGMVLVEAIAAGTPVVMPRLLARDLGGLEVVGHNEGGVIASSAAELAPACLEALGSLARLHGGVQRAQARHRQEYGMGVLAERAVLAAEIFLADTGSLESRMRELGFCTEVSPAWMSELLGKTTGELGRGKLGWAERALFELTHSSHVADLRRVLRSLRSGAGRRTAGPS